MTAYYNENDPFAAQWLRNLIAEELIAPGEVDDRDIRDVRPADLAGYVQCHFFAGIGVWSYALRLAGWPDDRPVWTGSCPCQPFSRAGKGIGFADERHLWPAWFWLIEQCRPHVVFGEQVASPDGLAWLDLVSTDVEALDYACGAVPFPAAGVGAPHGRQRIYFVADADRDGREAGRPAPAAVGYGRPAVTAGGARPLGNTDRPRLAVGPEPDVIDRPLRIEGAALGAADPLRGFWRGADWIWHRDGKYRAVEPGAFPLAHGAPGRVGQVRAYGNAIVAPQAAAFVAAYLDLLRERTT